MTKSVSMYLLILAIVLIGSFQSGFAGELSQTDVPAMVPVDLDSYLMWDRLPYHRIGIRAYMRSTYDRQGNNRGADASHFLYCDSKTFNVSLDVRGYGVLYFKRTNHWHGSPWHYEVDGEDMVVKETATADPENAKGKGKPSVFIPEDLFPNPLTWTWSITKGADLMWVPLGFEDRMRIAYGRTFYGTGYYIYHLMTKGMKNLSRPVEAWKRQPPKSEVLELLRKSGTDIGPKGMGVKKYAGTIKVEPFKWTTIQEIKDAPASIRALKFTVPCEDAYEFGQSRLRITWDGRWHASVDAPVALFFGVGHLYNNNNREYLVKGFPINVRYDEKNVYLGCYYPMPFFQNAKIEIQGRGGKTFENVKYEIRTTAFEDPINTVGYFHGTYSDHPKLIEGQDVTFLDTTKVEGGGDWSGSFVGMSWTFSHDGVLWTLEGDPRFIFDDSKTPQGWGTGTEEWGGGGDYWGGRNMTLPFAGHPVGSEKKAAKNDKDLLNSAYRFLIADIFPFGKNAKISLEHGGENNSEEHYEGVVYWYGIDSAALVRTDMVNVCDEKSIKEHNYVSPTAGEPYDLVSRYELGKDTGKNSEMFFAAEQDKVRVMKGTSKFEVKINKYNLGVMLRRKFDYLYPNQTAEVSVRAAGSWQAAGTWYTSGSNTCVFSWAKGELGEAEYQVITSNRRWREEEFLIGPVLTKGISKLEVKLKWVPDNRKMTPETAYPTESAWSASRYWVYCYQMPKVVLAAGK
ncbi:MAG: DUF2961 domain-containing protein [Planctomycetes bacterium]|nr:DUF2961 domain-containing protein [Planctomycetota bacterium]